MRAGRTPIALGAVLALAAAIYFVFEYENPVYAAPTLAAIPLAWSILQLTYRYWAKEHASTQDTASTSEQAAAAADWLADAVTDSWRKEAAARRISAPAPIAVRWRWAGGLSPREVGRLPVPGAGPSPLPGPDQGDRILTSGVVTRLYDELYTRLPRGRLVITGGPGSGKTAALILLLLEALTRREATSSEERPRVPVPVLLTLAGWDPASLSLSAWAANVLNRDYPALRAPCYGNSVASDLIGSGRVALFLDGLDEMPAGLRVAAIRRLNTEAPGLRIAATSRPAEYEEAVGQVPLEGAAVIELRPVRPAAAARFLLHEPPARNRTAWQKIADYIKENDDSTAAKALNNPLWLAMAREAYIKNDPTKILSSPTEDLVTAHLIDQFLARRYPGQRARRWLCSLARHLDGNSSHDLEWWRLGSMLNPATRILSVTLAASMLCALVCWIILAPPSLVIGLPTNLTLVPFPNHLVAALLDGLASGPIAGIIFGSAYAIVIIYGKAKFEPSKVPLRLQGPRAIAGAFHLRKHAVRTASGFLGGLTGGIIFALINVLGAVLYYGVRILNMDIFAFTTLSGIMFGLAIGISFFFISVLEVPSDTGTAATPLSLLAESRSRALLQAAIFVPMPTIIFAAGSSVASGLTRGIPDSLSWSLPSGLIMGAITGLVGTVSYILAFTAWGQWLVLARLMLPLTGRLPWRLTTFLQGAYDRGVLRQAGAVYQFRHLTLQTHLSQTRDS